MKKQLRLGIGLLVAVGAVVGVFAWRLNGPGAPHVPGAEWQWLPAVTGGELDKALARAGELVPAPPAAPPEYVEIANHLGVNPAFLDADFGPWDFVHWQRAWHTQRLADRLTRDADNDLVAIVKAVCDRLQPRAGSEPGGEPLAAWGAAAGNGADAAWLIAELAAQRGYEACLATLAAAPAAPAEVVVAELRRPGQVWVADPGGRQLYQGSPVSALTAKLWPAGPAAPAVAYLVPAWPPDFRPRNQALASRLRELTGPAMPRFGDDPGARARRFATAEVPVSFMQAPFRLFTAADAR